jgi:hypothetical protein
VLVSYNFHQLLAEESYGSNFRWPTPSRRKLLSSYNQQLWSADESYWTVTSVGYGQSTQVTCFYFFIH